MFCPGEPLVQLCVVRGQHPAVVLPWAVPPQPGPGQGCPEHQSRQRIPLETVHSPGGFPIVLQSLELHAAAAPRWCLQLGAPSSCAHSWNSLLAEQQLPALGGKGVLGMLDQAQRQGTLQENTTSLCTTPVTIFQLLSSFFGVCANQKTQAEEL